MAPQKKTLKVKGQSGYHSEETAIISDSEDVLFFLDGELAATSHCK